jgi:catechol 2,3-dioxygenase-like lactoylglutathione lyase family enzyme
VVGGPIRRDAEATTTLVGKGGLMGFHHVALATKDTAATHDFYTRVMGFELVKVVAAPTPGDKGGWSKHFFYDTGANGMIAFWELHDDDIGTSYPTDLSRSLGLPWWVNHLAFDAPTSDDLDAHTQRWRECGHTVLEVDHEWCRSIYIRDPNGIMVEFCHTVRPFRPDEIQEASRLLHDPAPALEGYGTAIVHEPIATPAPV